MLDVSIQEIDGWFAVASPFEARQILKKIPGRRWSPQRRQWYYPATESAALSLDQAIGSRLRQVPESYTQLLKQAQGAAQILKTSPDLLRPPDVKTVCHPHQVLGYHYLGARGGTYLAWDMGAGKSKPVVDLICRRGGRNLIVCPKSVIRVWEQEFKKHGTQPPRVILLYKMPVAERTALLKRLQPPFVVVTNYEAVWREPLSTQILAEPWDLVVADEIHRIKAPRGKASLFFERLRPLAKRRIGLSGTPMPHSPLDLFAQMRFIDPGLFGTAYYLYRDCYARMGGYEGKQIKGFKNLKELNERFYSIAHRVTKAEVLDLPGFQHIERPVQLSAKARRAYVRMETEFETWIEASGTKVTAANALVQLLRLQQMTGGTVTDENGKRQSFDDSKQQALGDLLEDLGPEEQVTVFCQFHPDLDATRAAAESQGRRYFELSGRGDSHWEWKDVKGAVLGVQIRSGSLGVELVASRYAVLYSTGFSFGDYNQALSRVHRQNQTREVTYFHLIAENTVDEKVYRALMKKKAVVERVLRQGEAGLQEMALDDIAQTVLEEYRKESPCPKI